MAPTDDSNKGTKVVVAYLDKKRERGIVDGFRPTGDGFTLFPPHDEARLHGRFVEFQIVKAVYFVKSLEGNRHFKENKLKLPPVYRQGRKVNVSFPDGETTVGTTEGFNPSRPGFFFYPADPKSNNLEVFIVTANADEIRILAAEPGGVDKVIRPTLERGMFLPEKRLQAVQRVLRGESVAEVAKELSVPPDTLAGWKARFLSGGPVALGVEQKKPG